MNESRVPAGVPTGGQFAATGRAEPDVDLAREEPRRPEQAPFPLPVGSSWHTSEPIDMMTLSAENRMAAEMVRQVDDGLLTLDAPYQRGSVWTQDQKTGLCRSLLLRVPVPTLIVNDRLNSDWTERYGYHREGDAYAAVIDGKQRIEAVRDWFHGRLPLPASWFKPEEVHAPVQAADGTSWVTYDGLTPNGQRRTENRFAFPVARGTVASIEEEASVYLLVNGAGTAQSDEDMATAHRVASGDGG